MLETALVAHMNGTAGVTALISHRFYPITLPQNPVLPAATFQLITEPRIHTLDGAVAPKPYVQVDCWGRTMEEALNVGYAISTALDGYRGTLGGSLVVSSCLQKARRHIFEPETQEYRVSLDFSFCHN